MAGLLPHVGDLSVPSWCARPGGVPVLTSAAAAVPVWMAVWSMNGRGMRPCVAADQTLADTLAISRRTLLRRWESLRRTPGLLLEISRENQTWTGRQRPHARFATDPLSIWWQTPQIIRRLAELAEQDGQGTEWYSRAERAVERHDRHARNLARLIHEQIGSPLCQDVTVEGRGGEEGGGGTTNSSRLATNRGVKKSRPAA